MNKKENINLIDIKERLEKSIAHLKGEQLIKTQKDISSTGLISESSLTRALKGNEKYLTVSFLKKYSKYYGFNESWLLEGKGEMLNSENTQSEIIYDKNASIPQPNDTIEGILDVVTLLFAQVNTQDKSLLFIQDQILKLVKKQDEMNKDMKELMKSLNKTTVKS
ncbi:hypothetical protein BAZ12_19570 [Elizabethkingia miricola]|uniref:helix-turn-helix domain-containing protein n=1 Tax=Elizabethkingia miricola TaxID=172045 RepID=UPI00099B2401|nr:helix-turn-helix domain-containing protein [Elizabethkingia miricola]OPC76211.1 hypothetical protein BAZ12_19570 [Elizabethkingia miricola]